MNPKTKTFHMFHLFISMSLIFPLLLGFISILKDKSLFIEWILLSCSTMQLSATIIIDWISMTFLFTVLLISSSIMKYSHFYMKTEKHTLRFLLTLFLFILSMCTLIMSPNMISMLLGWDGLGLTSYILIIFYQNDHSANAGTITILSNRIGDVSILMAIAITAYNGSWNFTIIDKYNTTSILLITLAACTKSAQIPFSAWLPAAMAAPTPVSSLVHSSTLVTAGVYLLIRFNKLILSSPISTKTLLITGTLTTLMASISANMEMDMKKIIALSTLSQLGLMMLSISMKATELAFFHLVTHAMFKSTLFMCAGFIIHNLKSSQDSRFISNMALTSPILLTSFALTNLALSGFPFLAAFYSKDLIFETSSSFSTWSVSIVLATLASAMTVSYSMRVMFITTNNTKQLPPLLNMSDTSKLTLTSLIPLYMTTLYLTYLYLMYSHNVLNPTPLSSIQKMALISLSMSALLFSLFLMNQNSLKMNPKPLHLMSSITLMWFMPVISSKMTSTTSLKTSLYSFKLMELGWLELYGPQSFPPIFTSQFLYTQTLQNSIFLTKFLMIFIISSLFAFIIFL